MRVVGVVVSVISTVAVTFAQTAIKPSKRQDYPRPAVVGNVEEYKIVPELDSLLQKGRYRIWQHRVHIPGAYFLKVYFQDLELAPGDVIEIYSGSGKLVDTLSGKGPYGTGAVWSLSVRGEILDVVFKTLSPLTASRFKITKLLVGTVDPFDEPESICPPADFEDVICYQSDPQKWANVMASVGVMSVGGDPNSATNGLWCSGSNVSPLNYLLTNYHCIPDASPCANSEFVFKYYRVGCNNNSPPTTDWVSFRCKDTVVFSGFSSCEPSSPNNLDFSLNSVIGDPSAVFGFVRPDPNPVTSGENIYIIQHPAGRPHEITHGGGANVVVDTNNSSGGNTLRYYDTLDTEGGSSGSPIFRESDDLMVGLHHCGGCTTASQGNRGMLMSDIYPFISSYLCTSSPQVILIDQGELKEVAGNGDNVQDPGEVWQFMPSFKNSACSSSAQDASFSFSVSASSTASAQLIHGTGLLGTLGVAATGNPNSYVEVVIDQSSSCGSKVVLDVATSSSNGNNWSQNGVLEITVGAPVSLFTEDFSGPFPGNWTIIDGGTGTGPASTWTTSNPGNRNLPLNPPFAIADSDALGQGTTMDESLISPVIDASGESSVVLEFDYVFRTYSGGGNEVADVDIKSSATGGSWVNVFRKTQNDGTGDNLQHASIDISAYAANQTDLQIRFRYYNANYDYYWAIDNIVVKGGNYNCTPSGNTILFQAFHELGNTSEWSNCVDC